MHITGGKSYINKDVHCCAKLAKQKPTHFFSFKGVTMAGMKHPSGVENPMDARTSCGVGISSAWINSK